MTSKLNKESETTKPPSPAEPTAGFGAAAVPAQNEVPAVCRACAGTKGDQLRATERQFNLGGSFPYFHCDACGSLSLEQIPADLARYYPETGYYSFNETPPPPRIGWRSRINAVYERLIGVPALDVDLIRKYVPDTSARILDVGSGAGLKLRELYAANYRNLTGIDPFLPSSLERETPIRLKKCSLAEAGGNWDLIMYHHVLEHIADPVAEMRSAASQLADNGYLLIRVPMADSFAFRHYGENWVQLDAPRHLWIPSRRALIEIGRKYGLQIQRTIDDSTPHQFWASRFYKKTTLPLNAAPRWGGTPRRRILRMPLVLLESMAAAVLNFFKYGDQSCLIFKKIA